MQFAGGDHVDLNSRGDGRVIGGGGTAAEVNDLEVLKL